MPASSPITKLRKTKSRPEDLIAAECDHLLKAHGWRIQPMHGNIFQKGVPDRYVWHPTHKARWIDYKVPGRNVLTPAQRKKWPEWSEENGSVGIWILTGVEDYQLLFARPNWKEFWKPRYGALDVHHLVDALAEEQLCENS